MLAEINLMPSLQDKISSFMVCNICKSPGIISTRAIRRVEEAKNQYEDNQDSEPPRLRGTGLTVR